MWISLEILNVSENLIRQIRIVNHLHIMCCGLWYKSDRIINYSERLTFAPLNKIIRRNLSSTCDSHKFGRNILAWSLLLTIWVTTPDNYLLFLPMLRLCKCHRHSIMWNEPQKFKLFKFGNINQIFNENAFIQYINDSYRSSFKEWSHATQGCWYVYLCILLG